MPTWKLPDTSEISYSEDYSLQFSFGEDYDYMNIITLYLNNSSPKLIVHEEYDETNTGDDIRNISIKGKTIDGAKTEISMYISDERADEITNLVYYIDDIPILYYGISFEMAEMIFEIAKAIQDNTPLPSNEVVEPSVIAPTNLESRILPKNAENTVSLERIKANNRMVNFHNESTYGRFYTENTFRKLRPNSEGKIVNPITRQPILPDNIQYYKAAFRSEGGKRLKKRKTRKIRKNKMTKNINKKYKSRKNLKK